MLRVLTSSAANQPRTPSSPPESLTSTFPLTTSGAMVMVSPVLISPSLVFQSSLPVSASNAIVVSSSVLKKDLAVRIGCATVDDVTARDALRRRGRTRLIGPFYRRARLGEI